MLYDNHVYLESIAAIFVEHPKESLNESMEIIIEIRLLDT